MSEIEIRGYVFDKEGKADKKVDKKGNEYYKFSMVIAEGYNAGGIFYPDSGVVLINLDKRVDYQAELAELRKELETLRSKRL